MDNNNWRPTQQSQSAGGGGGGAGDPAVPENGDWRAQLQPDSRQRIVNKIMETLKRHLPFSGQEGLQELRKIAVRFEEKIYTAATSQSDYLRKISMKMLTMETKSQNNVPNALPSNHPGNTSNPASNSMQSQVPNQGQGLPVTIPANQTQQRQQMASQTIQNNMASAGAPSSAGLTSAQPPVSGLAQTPISNVSGQNTVGISMSQGISSNVFSNSQGQQMQGRQQGVAQPQQQQSQSSPQYLYQQQMQQKLMKQKLQQGSIPQSIMQSHLQRQQPNILQPTQLQSSQQSVVQSSSVMQPSMMQSTPVSGLQQSSLQQSSQPMIQHQQSVLRQQQQQPQQAAVITQQQASLSQQPTLPTQQQQQQPLMGQQASAGNLQQNQLIGQQNQLIGQPNSIGDMQQQQQRFIGQQNNLSNMQQHQMMAQNRHQQQQLSSQNNASGLSHQLQQQQQQQQLLNSQSGNTAMQTGQHSVHLLQQSKVQAQPQTQSAASLLPTQGQQSQQLQQQLMSNIQSQPSQMQQQPNTLQQNMQQRLQPGSLIQQQTAADQQKQIFMSQRALPETSSTSMDSTAETGQAIGGDWQEEIYQKIKAMKEVYLPDLNEMYQRIAFKLQQHESLQQPPKLEQVEKLRAFEAMLKRMMGFLQLPKSNITMSYKDKLGAYEKQILNLINANRPGRRMPQGQLTMTQMAQQTQQSQSQSAQGQSQENQVNPQLQPINLRGPPVMQQNNLSSLQQNMASLQQNSMSTMSTTQQNMLNSVQPNPSLESGQANSLNSLQQIAAGSLQQNTVSSQPANINNLSTQNGVNVMQSNINSVHSNSNMLQQQHLKQQQEQHMLQTQQYKHMQQQLMQKQQIIQQQQQLNQQSKPQLSAQLQPQQLSQMYQMNEINDMKLRPGMNVKPGVLQPHSVAQRTAYQQLKSGSFPISSPQLQTASPQILQNSPPQVDQQNLLTSTTKASTPMQSTTPPFVAPSPSTSVAPSPMPGESEKPVSAVTTLSNAGNIGHQQPSTAGAPAQSLAIGTPGISASPLLAEYSGPDGTHTNALINVSGKSSITEQPIDRLIRAVKSLSPAALQASVSDIGAVVSMMDRVAGAAPGNGSRAAVGEDLVAMTKCRLQARNYMTHDGSANKKMRRCTSAMPLNIASSFGSANDSLKQSAMFELDSTATSNVKRSRSEANHALLEEIRQINHRLIDTVVDISDEDVDPNTTEAAAEGGEGTIVKCSYRAVALSPRLKAQYASGQLSPIQPLRLLVPLNYPNCSPVLLDKLPVEVSKEYEDLSAKAKSRFSISLRSLSQPMSLGEIARTWDSCTRAVICEYAQQSGGGSFSSKYGTWENCLSAA